MTTEDMYGDWGGRIQRRWRWRWPLWQSRFEYGRMHYRTNCCGDTLAQWWVWENRT